MVKIGLRIVAVCIFVLLAAYSSEARGQTLNEDTSAYIPAPALATTWQTWQEVYAALLWDYASRPFANYYWEEWEWRFVLHDINNNGIPLLFLIEQHMYGNVIYSAVYTFIDGELAQLEFDFQGRLSWGAIFAPLDDRAFIVDFQAVGRGGSYRRLELDGLTLVISSLGFAASLNEAGREKSHTAENIDWHQSYEWFELVINSATGGWDDRQLVTVQEFESIFLRRDERKWIEVLPITEENVERFIFGRE